MNKLRNTILDVASQIKGMNADIEHGAIVIRTADGTLRVGEIKHGTAYRVDMAISLRAGDVIVGYIHSHVHLDNSVQTLPSGDDFDNARDLRTEPYTDKGMILYILDNKSGDVFEYHAGTAHDTKKNGPNITDDTSKPCG